jgi:hypothetical protein
MTEACRRIQEAEHSIQLACCVPGRSVARSMCRRLSRAAELAVRIAACPASLPDFAGVVPASGGSLPPPNPC